MYTGTMIEQLMLTVKRVEEHARRELRTPAYLPLTAETVPAYPGFLYDGAPEQVVIGVA